MNTCVRYNERHCFKVMKLMNADRKVKKNYCDGTLKAEGNEYPVHKCVVGLVSEFLKTMFDAEMREKYEKVVKINNLTNDILGNILDFIYTGFVRITPDNVFDLLEGAEYMQIDDLKSSCKNYLVQSTNVENCLKLRAYGQRYNLVELCDASDRVIAENLANVIQHEDFMDLNSDAVFALINTRKEKVYEEVVFNCIVRWVNHNMDQRQEFFIKLFSLVDLSALSQTFLDKHVLSEPLVFSSMQCFQHLLNPTGPLTVVAKCSVPEIKLDKFVVIGGEGSEKTCVTYDSKGKHHLRLPELNERRCRSTAVKIQQHLFVAGGGDAPYCSSPDRSVEKLSLQSPREWVKIADMLQGRKHAGSAVSHGRMVVTGGKGRKAILRSCEFYNCERNQWFLMAPMLQARAFHGMVSSMNGLLYCVGGSDGSKYLSSAECYDEKIGEWKEIAPMSTARWGLAVVALNGFIYAIGGSDRSYLATVERYSPETNTWTKRGDLNVARRRPGACVIDGKIYVVGGSSNDGVTRSVEVYDEAEDKWEICYEMDDPAFSSAVVAV